MRPPSSVLRYLVLVLVLGFAVRGHADDRSEARAHFQAGVKYYSGGDYRSAIREFSAAQQNAPADLNNYNLALCYDKLGDAEPAIQYYRAFLDKQPNTDKRAEIEASIDRLDAASRSAASKKADEARKAEDAKRPAGPAFGPAPAPDALVAPPAGAAAAGPPVGPPPAPPAAPAERRKSGPAIQGTLGPSDRAAPASPSTGDAQLDHLNSIDIDQIRDQRAIGAAPEGRSGPAVAAAGVEPGASGPTAPTGAPLPPTGNDQPKKETALYKKWWFWAVVAVSGYVVYELATSSSSSSSSSRGRTGNAPGGLTLLSW